MNQETATSGDGRRRSHFPDWLYLVFLAFVFLGPVFDPTTTTSDWVLSTVTVVVSAVIYLIAMKYRQLRTGAAVALLAVGVVTTWLGTSAMGVIPIYAAALAAGFVPRRVLIWRLAAITVITLLTVPLSQIPPPYLFLVFAPALPMIWLIGFSVQGDIDLSTETHSLRAENARIQYLATITERERIARDLHDLAGQALTAVTLRSQLVQRLASTDPNRARDEAAAIEATARETLASLRETVAGWQHVDLSDELDKASKTLDAAGIEIHIDEEKRRDLAPSIETVLALALREAVTNVVRHAHARTCRISLDGRPGEVSLLITDDGVGIRTPEGSGLRGMRERVLAAGGSMEMTTGRGTRLRVSIPVGGQ